MKGRARFRARPFAVSSPYSSIPETDRVGYITTRQPLPTVA